MIQDSSIKWDPQRNAFILTDKTYENNILYMQYDPRNHQVPRIYRASCWLWNYLTHTREHLPYPCINQYLVQQFRITLYLLLFLNIKN